MTPIRSEIKTVLNNPRYVVILIAILVVMILLLSTSLGEYRFTQGAPLPGATTNDAGRIDNGKHGIAVPTHAFTSINTLAALAFVILLIYVLAKLLARINIRKLIWPVIITAGLFVLAIALPPLEQSAYIPAGDEITAPQIQTDIPVTPLGKPPASLTWITLIAMVIVVSIIAYLFLRDKPAVEPTPENQLLHPVENALESIRLGNDIHDVIIRCYLQMTEVLEKEKGIEFEGGMTTRDFEDILISRGFPAKAVRQLTRLFEKARYGKHRSRRVDEQHCIACLKSIIEHSRNGGVQ